MLTRLKLHLQRMHEREDEGFTLIELLVVLLILGILLGIAIPTFLSVTGGAKTTAAETNLQTALTTADTYYTNNNGAYGATATATVTGLGTEGSGLTYSTGTSSSDTAISVYQPTSDTNDLVLAAQAQGSTNCYFVADQKTASGLFSSGNTAAGTYYGVSTGTCSAADYATDTVTWSSGTFPSS